MERSYLIRYGMMGQVGRFAADPGVSYRRGQTVVVRSHRGTELGEVLIEAPARADLNVPPAGTAQILRAATLHDIERAEAASRARDDRFAACQRVFRDGIWPIELIDVEPLLDDRRTVLHYLGPHKLNVAGVLAAFRAACDLDVMLQPVGRDLAEDDNDNDETAHDEPAEHACGSGGSGGCGSESGGGCGTTSSGCADCGIKKLLKARR